MRRAHRRRHLDRERHPGLPLGRGHLGHGRPDRGRDDRRLPARPGAGLALVRAADRLAARGRAERRPPRARRARAARARAARSSRRTSTCCTARAGSAEVVEVHGSIGRAVCLRCGTPEPLAALLDQLAERADAALPRVRRDAEARRRPLRRAAAGRADGPRRARSRREAGLLLVVGTTLEVWPVGGLPERTRSSGGAVAIVNRGPTAFDGAPICRIEGGAGVSLDTRSWTSWSLSRYKRHDASASFSLWLLPAVPLVAAAEAAAPRGLRSRLPPSRYGRLVSRTRRPPCGRSTPSAARVAVCSSHFKAAQRQRRAHGLRRPRRCAPTVRASPRWYRVQLPAWPNGQIGLGPRPGRRR